MAHAHGNEVKFDIPAEDALCINTIRCLAADVVQKANAGHPGAPMGMAPLAHVLWSKFLNFNPADPKWPNRDRFILSNGHACALQYVMLHLCGYDVSMDELKRFRQLNSKTPGHPENVETPGVEVTTGPLGQGIANSVGFAIAEAHLAAEFNRPDFPIFDNFTYVFCGDGCLQEGVSHEAASLAGHLGLGRIIVIYDDNHVTIDGETDLSFSENIPKRFEAYGWHTQVVANGDTDLAGFTAAVEAAKAVQDKPSIICVRTTIGKGSKKEGTEAVHGAPLGAEDIVHVKTLFGFDPTKSFVVDDKVYGKYHAAAASGAEKQKKWQDLLSRYATAFPKEHAELQRRLAGKLPENWRACLPTWKPSDKADATRNTSGIVLNAVATVLPELIGGSADLTPSNKTALKGVGDFSAKNRFARYLRFGVREHGMIAAGNGIHAYGGHIPFTATFFNFIEYGFPSVRLAALSHFRQILIMTHDSIGLGEDGPTHQPIEAVSLCRATPNVMLLRPADGNEVSGSYAAAVENAHGPSVLCLSRHNLPHLPNTSIDGTLKGAYVIVDPEEGKAKPDLILVGTGSETHLCVGAAAKLAPLKVRVVSMPSWELFDGQPAAYRRSVFIPGVPVISVEAASITGWEKYAHFSIGMVTFGSSAPPDDVFKKFGFTADQVAERASKFLDTAKAQSAEMGLPFSAGLLPTHFDLPHAAKPLIAGHTLKNGQH